MGQFDQMTDSTFLYWLRNRILHQYKDTNRELLGRLEEIAAWARLEEQGRVNAIRPR